MTWHTEVGDRYLKGAEARLFRAALRSVLEAIEDDVHDFNQTMLARQSKRSLFQLFAHVGLAEAMASGNSLPIRFEGRQKNRVAGAWGSSL